MYSPLLDQGEVHVTTFECVPRREKSRHWEVSFRPPSYVWTNSEEQQKLSRDDEARENLESLAQQEKSFTVWEVG